MNPDWLVEGENYLIDKSEDNIFKGTNANEHYVFKCNFNYYFLTAKDVEERVEEKEITEKELMLINGGIGSPQQKLSEKYHVFEISNDLPKVIRRNFFSLDDAMDFARSLQGQIIVIKEETTQKCTRTIGMD